MNLLLRNVLALITSLLLLSAVSGWVVYSFLVVSARIPTTFWLDPLFCWMTIPVFLMWTLSFAFRSNR